MVHWHVHAHGHTANGRSLSDSLSDSATPGETCPPQGGGGTTAAMSQRGPKADTPTAPLSLEARGRNDRMLEKAMQSSTATSALMLRVDATIRGESQKDLIAAMPQLSPRTAALASAGVPHVDRPKRPQNSMVVVEEADDPNKYKLLQRKFFPLETKQIVGKEIDWKAEKEQALLKESPPEEAARAYMHKRQGWRGSAMQLGTCLVMACAPVPHAFFVPGALARLLC